jgi:hypothetical protein
MEAGMESRRQTKAAVSDRVRTGTLTFRLTPRLRALAEIAARRRGVTLANYVESALEDSLKAQEEFLQGASIWGKAEELYDEDPARCFLKRLRYPWTMDRRQRQLVDLIRTSRILYPRWNAYDISLIQQYWKELQSIVDGSDDARGLPGEIFEGVDIEFALLSEAERIALYQKDPEGCARRTQAYMQHTKREMEQPPNIVPMH